MSSVDIEFWFWFWDAYACYFLFLFFLKEKAVIFEGRKRTMHIFSLELVQLFRGYQFYPFYMSDIGSINCYLANITFLAMCELGH